jgi:hypothetical protein
LSIHGCPAVQYGVDWFHEFQVYAAHGWAVFFTNPRGSTGYGRAFQRGIENEWGGKDYVDIMNGLDAAIASNAWIDTTKLGVTGGSYGGYMTNWIIGHTNRFKAAVTLRGISNFISDEGTRDGAYAPRRRLRRRHLPEVRSLLGPLAAQVRAKRHDADSHPALDNDYRVPIEQGEQWFRAPSSTTARPPRSSSSRARTTTSRAPRAPSRRRESRLAALLVRQVPRRKDRSRPRLTGAELFRRQINCSAETRRTPGGLPARFVHRATSRFL